MHSTKPDMSSAVEDYAKAIYALGDALRAAPSRRTRSPSARRHAGVGVGDGQARSTSWASSRTCPTRACADRRRACASRSRCCATTACSSSTSRRALGVPWDRVHDEAEVLEHVLSEELEELIAAKLGDPTHDPHGDPIPTRDLAIDESREPRASQSLEPGARGTFVRVSDADPEMLRYLAERGIARATRSRSSSGSRSTARCSSGSATTCTCSAARSPARCAWRSRRDAAAASARRRRPARRPSRAERAPAAAPPGPGARRAPLARPGVRRRRSPTWTRATSRPTSPAARSTATCCCG